MGEQILTTRKQKYPFKTMGINDTFKVVLSKYNSMLTSYRQHNKKHPDMSIVLQCSDMGTGYIQVKRTA